MRIRMIALISAFSIQVLAPLVALAQTSTPYIYNQRRAVNPAVLVQKKSISTLAMQSGSGSGTYQQNQLEREKRTTTDSNFVFTSMGSDLSYQLDLVPTSETKIDEITQYSRAAASTKTMELHLNAGKKWNESVAYGVGLGTERNTTGSYTYSDYFLTAGGTYAVGSNFVFGLVSNLHYANAPAEQGRSWFDYGGGLSLRTESSTLKARLDYSTTKSPRVYQTAKSDIGAGYQRMWTENSYVAELAQDLSLFDLVLMANLKNRNYRALEDGFEERESIEDFSVGAVFANDRLGIFAGQKKQINKINLHVTTDKQTYASGFYSY